MKGFILAAGLGTRLRPITEYLPKPIVPILSTTSLEICYNTILKNRISDITINLHHLSEKIKKYIELKNIKCNLSIELPEILGTGGGLGKLKNYFAGDDVLIYNADVISDIDLKILIDYHQKHENFATLALIKNNAQTDGVLIDENNCIIEFNDAKKNGYTFTGISIVSKQIYCQLPENNFYNIIDLYNKIIKSKDAKKIQGLIFKNVYWTDIGTVYSYWKLVEKIASSQELQNNFFINPQNNELQIFKKCKSIFINSIPIETIKNSIVLNNIVIFSQI
ncbi:MAG TPA: sugar phosphate nucleotidyltransferase [bacterium]|nr:sugar phosphate nucleotidyltransferase [bacterium]HPP87652.1 sugar phosphate nucleotidyltransferase [bacterium]